MQNCENCLCTMYFLLKIEVKKKVITGVHFLLELAKV